MRALLFWFAVLSPLWMLVGRAVADVTGLLVMAALGAASIVAWRITGD